MFSGIHFQQSLGLNTVILCVMEPLCMLFCNRPEDGFECIS